MKRYALLTLLLFIFSCAPLICPEEQQIKQRYSYDSAPQRYTAYASVSYGVIKFPFVIKKEGASYLVEAGTRGSFSFNIDGVCVNGVCLDLPFSPDGIIFGAVLRGDEKASCQIGHTVVERDDGSFRQRFYFAEGQLQKVEVLDKKRDKLVVLTYGPRTKEGFYRRVKVDYGDISLVVNVDEVRY
ncbi:hypothetical protein Thal_1451 [Thermocrinis albus DSM 14484]|uniref:Lipoprotein n=1 Tax=Thermocrinis albus (strain DSM 14484 / JCM 11386 / HI 11/12) TaxID=638303 RepID=D3SMV0_THEAH|nr:hypothetical protein [Thermocrinis albus]ADC90080.1 hypothetical protein Thal_1451 [Thermocrinis albus DSM 14484]